MELKTKICPTVYFSNIEDNIVHSLEFNHGSIETVVGVNSDHYHEYTMELNETQTRELYDKLKEYYEDYLYLEKM